MRLFSQSPAIDCNDLRRAICIDFQIELDFRECVSERMECWPIQTVQTVLRANIVHTAQRAMEADFDVHLTPRA